MLYRIIRNKNLTDLPEVFTARDWTSAVNKVTKSLQNNVELMKHAKEHSLLLANIAWDMIVEIGKDY
jgi:hypothetical protein